MLSRELRLLRALEAAERWIADGLEPRAGLVIFAQDQRVPAEELSLLLVAKLVGTQRARAWLASVDAADAEFNNPAAVKALAPRQRRPKREADA